MLAVALAASGCVGIGVAGTDREVHDSATWGTGAADTQRRLPQAIPESAEALRTRRGAPDDIERVREGVEAWTYDDGLRLGGVVLFVVIPLPLVVPIGEEHVTYTVENGEVTRTEYVRQRWRGAACGFVNHRIGCESWDTAPR